jgi:DNA-binding MarR family transcriptional regulator
MQDKRLQRSIGYALVRAFRVVNRASSRALAPLGLSAEQAHVLLILWFEGPMKVGELQRVLALGSGTLTGALDRLEKAGLTRRIPDEKDKRAFRVEASQKSLAKKEKVRRTLEAMEEELFGRLPDQKKLLANLEAIAATEEPAE